VHGGARGAARGRRARGGARKMAGRARRVARAARGQAAREMWARHGARWVGPRTEKAGGDRFTKVGDDDLTICRWRDLSHSGTGEDFGSRGRA
jgi:hypothetical protein